MIGTAALATGAGFLVLLLSPIPQVRGFGLLLVLGIALAFALALTAGLATLSLTGGARDRRRRAPAPARGLGRRSLSRLRVSTPEALTRPAAARHRVGIASRAQTRRGARAGASGRRALGASIAAPGRRSRSRPCSRSAAGCGHPHRGDLRSSRAGARELPALRDVDALQEATGVSGEIDVTVRAPDLTDPEVIAWMRDFEDRVLDRAGFEGEPTGCVDQETRLCPRSRCPTCSAPTASLTQKRVAGLLELLPPYFSQAVVSRDLAGDPQTAVIAFGIKVMPFDEQKELIDAIRAEIDPPGTENDPPDGVQAEVVGLPVLAADANSALEGNHYLLSLVGAARGGAGAARRSTARLAAR